MSNTPILAGGVVDQRDWRERLAVVVDMMRTLSRQTDPQEAVQTYATQVRRLTPADRIVSLSRRGLAPPQFRITRTTLWQEEINPWKQRDRLPLLSGGLLAGLIYADEPRILNDLVVPDDDPAREYLAGQRSLMALPLFDGGEALNMVVLTREQPGAFDAAQLPESVWTANLFGRATHNLVLRDELRTAYDALDRELRVVAQIQRSLLPPELPRIDTLDLAASYETAAQVGGDYYDFFPLADGRWGILLADVSGHGTPAAVLMAVTHAIAHSCRVPTDDPPAMLTYLNENLHARYTHRSGHFVTAFYGIYEPHARLLHYASAGHHPPRLKRCDDGTMATLSGGRGVPLGVVRDADFPQARHALRRGDQLIFFTDGITEARNRAGEMFGEQRLDAALEACRPGAAALIDAVHAALSEFVQGLPAEDDRTLLVAKVL
jgi:sigma-B regulation protein RsbU (phosphoserine phosphatase)